MKKSLLIILPVLAFLAFTACNNQSSKNEKKERPQLKKEVASQQAASAKKSPAKAEANVAKHQKALISTKYGDITVLLYDDTPKHRDNFIKLVKDGFYDGTLFHRVMEGFMIQGGDPDSKGAAPGVRLGNGGPGYTIEAEFRPEHIHKKGALAAARQPDAVNPEKRSSGSQFYIVQGKPVTAPQLNQMAKRTGAFYTPEQIKTYQEIGGTPFLDNNYTVFGEVIDGMDVIDKIAAVKTDPNNRPVKDVEMTIKLIDDNGKSAK